MSVLGESKRWLRVPPLSPPPLVVVVAVMMLVVLVLVLMLMPLLLLLLLLLLPLWVPLFDPTRQGLRALSPAVSVPVSSLNQQLQLQHRSRRFYHRCFRPLAKVFVRFPRQLPPMEGGEEEGEEEEEEEEEEKEVEEVEEHEEELE